MYETLTLQERFALTCGTMPRADLLHTPLPYTIAKTWETETYTRHEIYYSTEPGSRTRAFLMLPKGYSGKRPAMLCPHQTNGKLGGAEQAGLCELDSFHSHCGLELCERGYVTLSPDTHEYGVSEDDPYALGYVSGTMKDIFDHMRGIDLLCALDMVDPERIGSIGHSLGGHNTMYAAFCDERIKVAASSCGLCAASEYVKTNAWKMGGWAQKKYMPLIREKFDLDPAKMPWDFPELVASIAPRAVFINSGIHDSNQNYAGARMVTDLCEQVFAEKGVPEKLKYIFHDTGHEFPDAVRKEAYAFIDSIIG